MSKTLKIVLGVLVIVLIGAGAWWYMGESSTSSSLPATQAQQDAAAAAAPALSQGSSDSDLSQDAKTIDGQMNGLNSDNASIDQGMSSN